MSADRSDSALPDCIEVWACPTCGYWRREESTGIHMSYPTNRAGERHPLVKVPYRLALDEERS